MDIRRGQTISEMKDVYLFNVFFSCLFIENLINLKNIGLIFMIIKAFPNT